MWALVKTLWANYQGVEWLKWILIMQWTWFKPLFIILPSVGLEKTTSVFVYCLGQQICCWPTYDSKYFIHSICIHTVHCAWKDASVVKNSDTPLLNWMAGTSLCSFSFSRFAVMIFSVNCYASPGWIELLHWLHGWSSLCVGLYAV
jgi:hypothetical protein